MRGRVCAVIAICVCVFCLFPSLLWSLERAIDYAGGNPHLKGSKAYWLLNEASY